VCQENCPVCQENRGVAHQGVPVCVQGRTSGTSTFTFIPGGSTAKLSGIPRKH
jgi:hypothetical protein